MAKKSPFLEKYKRSNFFLLLLKKCKWRRPAGKSSERNYKKTVWPESLGPKTPKGNLKTPKKNTTLKTRKHHVFGYKNTKYLIKSFKNGPPKHFYCIFVHQFLKNFNFFTEIFQKISIFSNF